MSNTRSCGIMGMLFLVIIACSSVSCAKKGMSEDELSTYVKAKESYLAGDYAKSVKLVDSARFTYGTGHQAFLLKAKCEFFGQNPERAEAILKKILKAHPRYAEAEIWLVRAILAQGRLDEAETAIERAMEWNPEDPRLLSLMGSVQQAKKEYRKAFEYYTRSTGFAEETGKDEIALAELYWRFGQSDKALERIRRARNLVAPESAVFRPLEKLEERMLKEQNQ